MNVTNGFVNGKPRNKEVNGGFSLVELIIVIAIMAVLVGVVGTQVVPYLESTKQAKDVQVLSGFATAGMSAYSFHPDSAPDTPTMEIEITPGEGEDIYTCDAAPDIAAEMKRLVDKDYVWNANASFESKQFKATRKIIIVYDFENRTISVNAYDAANVLIPCEHAVLGRL